MVPWFRGEVGGARAAVVAYFVLAGVSFSAWAVRIPDVKAALRLDDATLGLALLGTAAGSVVAMTGSGWTIARFGSRRVTVATALLVCTSLVLPALAPSAPLLFAALFVFGAAYGALDVAMNAQAVAVEERWGRPIMSSFHGMFSTGTLLGSFVAGLVAGRGIPPAPICFARELRWRCWRWRPPGPSCLSRPRATMKARHLLCPSARWLVWAPSPLAYCLPRARWQTGAPFTCVTR